MSKYKIYTIVALIIMSVCFTLPVLGWHGAKERIANGDELHLIVTLSTIFIALFSIKTTFYQKRWQVIFIR